jgi:hypothetical protein
MLLIIRIAYYASLLIIEKNTSFGSIPMCSASQTNISTFCDLLLESANLRKFQFMIFPTRAPGFEWSPSLDDNLPDLVCIMLREPEVIIRA